MRKRVRALLSALLFIPVAGWGLGLGDIHVRSSLNERLSAEIDLLSVDTVDPDNLNVSLASYETFAKVGLERSSALMLLRFDVQQTPDGRHVVEVNSVRPIREPFLEFLVEVNWPSGRLLRQYTLLLDPPDIVRDAPPAVATPATAAPPADARLPATAQAADLGGRIIPAPAVSSPASSGASSARPMPRVPAGGISYGPVRVNDTLWSIAKKLRPNPQVNMNQMMLALLRANPDAFINNNIHRLKKGAVLRLNDPGMITAMSRAEAAREVRMQSRAWQDFKGRAAAQAPQRKPTQTDVTPPAAAVGVVEEAKLRLAAPEKGEDKDLGAPGVGGESSDLKKLRQELMLATESAEAHRLENEELKKRLAELEEAHQRLISLKDDNLAALQQQLRAQKEAAAAALTERPEPLAVPEPVQAAEENADVKPASKPVEAAQPEGEAANPAAEKPEAKSGPAEPKLKPETKLKTPKPEAKAPKEKPAPKAAPAPPAGPQATLVDKGLEIAEQGLEVLKRLTDRALEIAVANPLYPVIAGVSLVVLILGGMLIKRRRAGTSFQESILSGGTPSMLQSGVGDSSPASESSFLSDLTVSGMGADVHEESEVDPLTEADVYMAYGRHQQAEELIKDALSHHPERSELTAKLLEIYHSTGDAASFEEVAKASQAKLKETPALWSKVLVLGHELLPEHPMFREAPEGSALGQLESRHEPGGDVLDIGLDLDALAEEMEPSPGKEEAAGEEFKLDLGLDFSDLDSDEDASGMHGSSGDEPAFDLDGLGMEEESTSAALAVEADDDGGGLDFDLGSFASEEESASAALAAEADDDDGGGLDFNLGSFASEEESETTAEVKEEGDLDFGLDFDLGESAAETNEGSLDFSLDTDEAETEAEAESITESAAESLDFDLDLGAGGSSDEDSGSSGLDFDLGDFGEPEREADNSADTSGGFSLDDLDLGDFELDSTSGDADSLSDDSDLDEFGDLGSMDEIGTKLDLAKAYVEMGDADGARDMLHEVVQEGSAEQKERAQELLQQIAS